MSITKTPGPCFNIKLIFPCMGIPMLKIRWLRDCLIFNMGIPILVRQHFYIEMAPRIWWALLEEIWVRSRRCSCLVTWFCYHLIAKPGSKTAAPSWPDPYVDHVECQLLSCFFLANPGYQQTFHFLIIMLPVLCACVITMYSELL